MKRLRSWLPSHAPGLVALWVALFLSSVSPAESVEVGELMKKMQASYERLVETVIMKPLRELADTDFEGVKKEVEIVLRLAKELPQTEGNQNIASFKTYSEQLAEKARELGDFADKKNAKGSVGALVTIWGACANCHGEFRF